MGKAKYARRTDANHADVLRGLRQLNYIVDDVSHMAGLGYDLIMSNRPGEFLFIEVKPRTTAALTNSEDAARLRYGRYWAVATSPEEAHQRYREVWDA